eukprot:756498-Hanusia_phi.AAC.4
MATTMGMMEMMIVEIVVVVTTKIMEMMEMMIVEIVVVVTTKIMEMMAMAMAMMLIKRRREEDNDGV